MSDKLIQQISKNIGMVKNIKIGDPMYFEEFKNSPLLDTLVYDRRFRGKGDWVGFVSIKEFEDSFDAEYGPVTLSYIDIELSFAPNEELLNIYKRGLHYSYQKVKPQQIGVDTASYTISINDITSLIRTGTDGYLGDIFEYYNKNKLEGIYISLGTGDCEDFSSIKEMVETLFNIKF